MIHFIPGVLDLLGLSLTIALTPEPPEFEKPCFNERAISPLGNVSTRGSWFFGYRVVEHILQCSSGGHMFCNYGKTKEVCMYSTPKRTHVQVL